MTSTLLTHPAFAALRYRPDALRPGLLFSGPIKHYYFIVPRTTAKAFSSKETAAQPASPTGVSLSWPHKGWDDDVVLQVTPSHRKPRTAGDRIAWRLTRVCRWAMDLVTGMGPEQKVDARHPTTSTHAMKSLIESQWVGTVL
jgi:hypothetical protein